PREKFGIFRANAFIPPVKREVVTWPRSTGGISATWAAENGALPESTATFDGVTAVPKKLVVFLRASNELNEDSGDGALGNWFADEAGRAFAEAEDKAGFAGDGTSTYAGIRGITKILIDGNHNAGKVAATTGHDTFAEIDSVDIGALVAALPARALPNAAFYCSNYAFGTVFCRLA